MASSNQVGAAEGIVLPIELESATGRAQLLRQLEAYLKSLHSGLGTEQNTPVDELPVRSLDQASTDFLFTLIARHELKGLSLDLQRLFEQDTLFRDFLVKRCQRCIRQPEYYAVNVLAGQAPHLLRDDLNVLLRDLGATPATDADWITLAALMSALRFDHVHFATVCFVFRYRYRLITGGELHTVSRYECPRIHSRFYGEWSTYSYFERSTEKPRFRMFNLEWSKATSKAAALLFDQHPEWTSETCRFVLSLTANLSEQYHDFRYLARITANRFSAFLQLPAMLRANTHHFSTQDILRLTSGSSIRDIIDLNPGKKLVKAYHTLPATVIPVNRNFWPYLLLITFNCPTEHLTSYLRFFDLHAYRYRNEQSTNWWDSSFMQTTVRKMIAWNIVPGPVFDYISHRLQEGNFQLTGRTLASVTRLAEQWHEELIQRRLSQVKDMPTKWSRYPIEDWITENYRIIQLTTTEDLVREGATLGHCVGSYAYRCARGFCSIHSLQFFDNDQWISQVTIEVASNTRKVVQSRGKQNALPEASHKKMIVAWSTSQDIGISSY